MTAVHRWITRWEHEHVLEAVQRRLDELPEKMRQRRETIEHPFGTIKARMRECLAGILSADGRRRFRLPSGTCGNFAASEVSRDRWSEFDRPAADGFITDFDAALRKQFLDIAKAQRKSEVQPHCLPDDVSGKSVPFK